MAKIFIGSSSRMVPLVNDIAGCLKSHGHDPQPWNKIFKTGDIHLDRLLKLAREVDGAILVFSGDDEGEHNGSTVPRPPGNVLIEYGLFAGILGRRRTIICDHGENRKPSDLSGLSYLDAGSEADHLSPEARDKLGTWAANLSPDPDGVTEVFSSFPLAEFRQALRQARCLHILQTFIPYTQHLHLFEADLMDAIKRGCEVQVLLLSPSSSVVDLRQQALNSVAYGRNIVRDQIRINLEHLAALARELPRDKRSQLEVRVHTTMPSTSIYRVNDVFFCGHYFQGNLAIDSPQLRVSNPQSSMGKRLESEHRLIWQANTTLPVNLDDIEPWLS